MVKSDGQNMVGRMVSKTVTVAVQVDAFMQESLANKVTVFTPTLPQSKFVLLRLKVLAVLPLSISATVKVAEPFCQDKV